MALLSKTTTTTLTVETTAHNANSFVFSFVGPTSRMKITVSMADGRVVRSMFPDTVLTAAQMTTLRNFFQTLVQNAATAEGFA